MSESRHILFLIGIPGSGKSTFAKEKVRSDPSYKRVNKDELRFLLHDEDYKRFDRAKEEFVVSVRDRIILESLHAGFNVIVDDTNIEGKHLQVVKDVAHTFTAATGIPVTVEEKVFTTPLEECLRRNALREGKACVPEKVIKDMNRKLIKDRTAKPYRPYNRELPECIVTDMDGTASLLNGRNPYDAKGCINDLPNQPVVQLLKDYQYRCAIIVVSGREDKDREETEQWLRNQGIRFAGDHDGRGGIVDTGIVAVHMRVTGDSRNDAVIKTEIYEKHILPFYNVRFVLDDRNRVVDAIRDLGVPVFQVAPGDF